MRLLTLARFALALLAASHPAVAQTAPNYGPEIVFEPTGGDQIDIAALDGSRFVVAFRSGEGKVRVGEVAYDGSITVGPDVIFDTGAVLQQFRVEALDDSRFVITYRRGSEAYAIAGEVSGQDVHFGPPTFLGFCCYPRLELAVLDSERFVATYSDGGAGLVRVCSVSGVTISLGAEVTFEPVLTTWPRVAALDGDRFVIVFGGKGTGGAIIGEASGTTAIALGAAVSLPAPPIFLTAVTALDSDRFVFSYMLADSSEEVAVGSSVGLAVTGIGAGVSFHPPSVDVAGTWLEALGPDVFAVSWWDGSPDEFGGCFGYGTCSYHSRKGAVAWDTVSSFSEIVDASETIGEPGGSDNFAQARIGLGESFLIAYDSPGGYDSLLRYADTDGGCAFRNESGSNPPDYACGGTLTAGQTWKPTIETAPSVGFTTAATIIGFGLGGPLSGVFLPAGELLILPPIAQHIALGAHEVALGPNVPVGLSIASQGARVEVTLDGGIVVVLLNGLDLVVGG